MKCSTDWLVDQLIAHRGYHSGDYKCPENSLAAFQEAVNRGFAIELDVHASSDGEVVVLHDENTLRMTGVDKAINRTDSNKITQMPLLGSDQHIPTLGEVLDLVRGRVPLLIELKNYGKAGKLEEALAKSLNSYEGAFAVQSFNPFSLRRFKLHAEHVRRGQLSGGFGDMKLPLIVKLSLKNLLLNGVSRPSFINYDIRYLPNRAVNRQRKNGVPILGWTAVSLQDYRRARTWCDNVVFEGFDPSSEFLA